MQMINYGYEFKRRIRNKLRTFSPVADVASRQHLRSATRQLQVDTAPPAQLLWLTGFLCGWSVGLEFPAGQLAESGYWREQFQTISEDVSVRNVLMHSAH